MVASKNGFLIDSWGKQVCGRFDENFRRYKNTQEEQENPIKLP
jgi:hypothetical protein